MSETTARAYRDVLAIPGARALIAASAASQIGNWLYNAALLGYVYSATHSAGWVGAATICRLLRAPSGRRDSGERDDQRHGSSGRDRRGNGRHDQQAQRVTGQQDGTP